MTSRSRPPARKAKPAQKARFTVMLVDDHPIWRDTLRRLLEHSAAARVVAEAADGNEARDQAAIAQPDVIVMDINLPGLDGIEATRHIVRAQPSCKVLVLASSNESGHVIKAIRAGAAGYLLKTAAPDDVVAAVVRVHNGELVFPAAVAELVLGELRQPRQHPQIWPRIAIAVSSVLDREALLRVLETAPVEIAATASRPDDLDPQVALDVIVVDDETLTDGASLPGRADQEARAANVLVLARNPRADRAVGLLLADAGPVTGYLRADRINDTDEIVQAILRLASGEPVLDTQIVDGLVEQPTARTALDRLTPRELEVLALMAEGHSNQAISERLFVSQKAIEAHIRNVFIKLDLEPASDIHRRVLAVVAYLRSS